AFDLAFGRGVTCLPPDASAAASQRDPYRRRRHPGLLTDRGQTATPLGQFPDPGGHLIGQLERPDRTALAWHQPRHALGSEPITPAPQRIPSDPEPGRDLRG